MHTILYPPGHKKDGQRKAAKDLTDGERRTIEDQKKLYYGRRRMLAGEFLGRINDAEKVLNEDAV